MNQVIWWIRRDLRLFDNPALHEAIKSGAAVVPLFILDDTLWKSPFMSTQRIAFMLGGLRELGQALQERGSRLIVQRGRPLEVLKRFTAEHHIEAIYAQEDYSPYATKRDKAIAAELPLKLTHGTSIRPVGTILKDDGHPYVVYTPYKNKWLSHSLPRANQLHNIPETINTPDDIDSLPVPDEPVLTEDVPFVPGETAGRKQLHNYANDKIRTYGKLRDQMAVDGTSKLSPYLRFGMISPREAAVFALEAKATIKSNEGQEGAHTWLEELIWRDFYMTILHYFPHVRGSAFRPEYDNIIWRNDEAEFIAWCHGRTGYPIVDAAMRQLNTLGWMHNRARMIVASFLIKDLLIDWRWGEKYFMQQLIDGDPAANNGGWQWTAGCGTDAAPYFRIFNPISQGERYDKQGAYIRKWVPELEKVPLKYIHTPWKMPQPVQVKSDCQIGRDYPAPIVDHKIARQRTLDAYKTAREQDV